MPMRAGRSAWPPLRRVARIASVSIRFSAPVVLGLALALAGGAAEVAMAGDVVGAGTVFAVAGWLAGPEQAASQITPASTALTLGRRARVIRIRIVNFPHLGRGRIANRKGAPGRPLTRH